MSSEMQMPSSRYVLPSFVEHSAFGAKESNPYNKLFEERIIFLGTQVDDASANDIMAQLLVLTTRCSTFAPTSRLSASDRRPPPQPCCWPLVPPVSARRFRMRVC